MSLLRSCYLGCHAITVYSFNTPPHYFQKGTLHDVMRQITAAWETILNSDTTCKFSFIWIFIILFIKMNSWIIIITTKILTRKYSVYKGWQITSFNIVADNIAWGQLGIIYGCGELINIEIRRRMYNAEIYHLEKLMCMSHAEMFRTSFPFSRSLIRSCIGSCQYFNFKNSFRMLLTLFSYLFVRMQMFCW